ncbi:hypothetical protein L6R29_16410 [Myxococcota bacterium]|nr:hypothetical protein [Myxococcota bacterium]
MTLEEMKQMAYWHADAETPGPFCPGCYSPLHGDLAFFWHKQCFLGLAGPAPLPTATPQNRRRQPPAPPRLAPQHRQPPPSYTQQPSQSFEAFSRPVLRCHPSSR